LLKDVSMNAKRVTNRSSWKKSCQTTWFLAAESGKSTAFD